ncbi:MAG TPA: hypothetical protein PKO06_17530, partial [Candidatus Ozemobacteraceae bacterium]|nr:hypothetical protein [Candidatus Ozemobacteraceae bacterium]
MKRAWISNLSLCSLFLSVLLILGCEVPKTSTPSGSTPSATRTDAPAKTETAPASAKPFALQLTSLYRQSIPASNTQMVIEHEGKVRVTVPADAFGKPVEIVISKPETLPPPTPGCKDLAAYDISVGDKHVFDQLMTIDLSFSPQQIDSDLPPEKALLVSFWNEQTQTWHIAPSLVDVQNGRVTAYTNHLSLWKLTYIARGYRIKESDHFRLIYDPNFRPTLTRPHPKKPTMSITTQEDPDDFAQRVLAALQESHRKYVVAGFTEPDTKIDLGLGELLKKTVISTVKPSQWVFGFPTTWVFIVPSVLESYRNGLTGSVYISRNFDSPADVSHTCAHEYFHVLQNLYANIYSLGIRKWWVEATAEYAAGQVAFKMGPDVMGDQINYFYPELPLTHKDDVHEYATSHFLHWLVKNGADFRQMWEATMSMKAVLSVIIPLDTYLTKSTHKGLATHYQEFLAWLLFDPTGPIPDPKNEFATQKHFAKSSLAIGPSESANWDTQVP